jgi:hypothetical protein
VGVADSAWDSRACHPLGLFILLFLLACSLARSGTDKLLGEGRCGMDVALYPGYFYLTQTKLYQYRGEKNAAPHHLRPKRKAPAVVLPPASRSGAAYF